MLLSINPYALVLYAFKFSSFVNIHNFLYVSLTLNIQQGESWVSKTFVSAMMTVSAHGDVGNVINCDRYLLQ